MGGRFYIPFPSGMVYVHDFYNHSWKTRHGEMECWF
jgi:hypothetical protein